MADLFDDIALLLFPPPIPPTDPTETEAYDSECARLTRAREDTVARLRRLWDTADRDPLLQALSEQRQIRDEAEERIRRLVAYAREFVAPRPYTLDALAPVLGTSPSGVRGVYDHRDAEQAAAITSRRSIVPQTPADTTTATKLVEELTARITDEQIRDQAPGVASALLEHGWTPFAPVRRTANPKYAKHYVRWEKRWPNGTVISLYQEPNGWLGVYARMSEDDPRWFNEPCGGTNPDDGKPITASDVFDALTIYDATVTRYDTQVAASASTS